MKLYLEKVYGSRYLMPDLSLRRTVRDFFAISQRRLLSGDEREGFRFALEEAQKRKLFNNSELIKFRKGVN